jgi:hypothetical protein
MPLSVPTRPGNVIGACLLWVYKVSCVCINKSRYLSVQPPMTKSAVEPEGLAARAQGLRGKGDITDTVKKYECASGHFLTSLSTAAHVKRARGLDFFESFDQFWRHQCYSQPLGLRQEFGMHYVLIGGQQSVGMECQIKPMTAGQHRAFYYCFIIAGRAFSERLENAFCFFLVQFGFDGNSSLRKRRKMLNAREIRMDRTTSIANCQQAALIQASSVGESKQFQVTEWRQL